MSLRHTRVHGDFRELNSALFGEDFLDGVVGAHAHPAASKDQIRAVQLIGDCLGEGGSIVDHRWYAVGLRSDLIGGGHK